MPTLINHLLYVDGFYFIIYLYKNVIGRIEKMESKKSDWARGTIKEVPFWREDMSVEEYEEERNYLNQHWTDYMNNRYIPLWKQREK